MSRSYDETQTGTISMERNHNHVLWTAAFSLPFLLYLINHFPATFIVLFIALSLFTAIIFQTSTPQSRTQPSSKSLLEYDLHALTTQTTTRSHHRTNIQAYISLLERHTQNEQNLTAIVARLNTILAIVLHTLQDELERRLSVPFPESFGARRIAADELFRELRIGADAVSERLNPARGRARGDLSDVEVEEFGRVVGEIERDVGLLHRLIVILEDMVLEHEDTRAGCYASLAEDRRLGSDEGADEGWRLC